MWGIPSASTARLIWAFIANADFAGSTACTRSTSFPNSDGKNLCQKLFQNFKILIKSLTVYLAKIFSSHQILSKDGNPWKKRDPICERKITTTKYCWFYKSGYIFQKRFQISAQTIRYDSLERAILRIIPLHSISYQPPLNSRGLKSLGSNKNRVGKEQIIKTNSFPTLEKSFQISSFSQQAPLKLILANLKI